MKGILMEQEHQSGRSSLRTLTLHRTEFEAQRLHVLTKHACEAASPLTLPELNDIVLALSPPL